MEYVAVFDVGTSAIKGVLIDRQANVKYANSVDVETYDGVNGEMEQSPLDWWTGVKKIANWWWQAIGVDPEEIEMITFSGQMEDVIPIAHPQPKAILYSDTRANDEAEWIQQTVPTISQITGNTIKPSTPCAKLSWLKQRQPDEYIKAERYVFSAKDFVIYQLTNTAVTDPTTGATTGMMDIEKRQWEIDIMSSIGISVAKLPALMGAEEVVGYITKEASLETGFCKDMPVLCGCGDAGASTMGAGAVVKGDSYGYIGTTGWTAVVQEKTNENDPDDVRFQLAHLPDKTRISIAPLLNAGNVHRWAVDTFIDSSAPDKYAAFERLVSASSVGSGGILFLPYLNGERFPVRDAEAKGAFWGIGPHTSKSDLARSVIEGLSFSFKQLMDVLMAGASGSITLIGGGTNSVTWCSVLADCLGRPIYVPEKSAYMPAVGVASSAFIQLGWANDYSDFVRRFLQAKAGAVYEPNAEHHRKYEEIYQRFLRMYPAMKGV